MLWNRTGNKVYDRAGKRCLFKIFEVSVSKKLITGWQLSPCFCRRSLLCCQCFPLPLAQALCHSGNLLSLRWSSLLSVTVVINLLSTSLLLWTLQHTLVRPLFPLLGHNFPHQLTFLNLC